MCIRDRVFDLTVSHKQLGRWLEQAQQGDEGAFAKLYAATVEAQYYQAMALLGNPHLADDAVQDSYASLYKNAANIRDPQAVVALSLIHISPPPSGFSST